jgi:hypothetical protein
MGSIVEYRCTACTFATGHLSVGWGKAGRRRFWGGLARCSPCKKIGVIDLTTTNIDRGGNCVQCGGLLTLLEGISQSIECPRCGTAMHHAPLGTWM